MAQSAGFGITADLRLLGITASGGLRANASVASLYEHALRRGEGKLGAGGQFVALTGRHTERTPEDRFFVREPSSERAIDWSTSNRAIEAAVFDALFERVAAYLSVRECFAVDAYLVADERDRIGVRVVSDLAWHALFARTIFIEPASAATIETASDAAGPSAFTPDFTIVDAAGFHAEPARDGTRSDAFVLIHFGRKLVLIGGTSFAGEIKKAAFTVVNHLAPLRGTLPMHCSANASSDGSIALYFGVSGSGKTTLAADSGGAFIGDDEHVWTQAGIANIEAGCYPGVLDLDPDSAPDIWAATHRFGTVLENVACDPATRQIDLANREITDNPRAAYPVSHVRGALTKGVAAHPRSIVILTSDAFGVLPPVAKLSSDQATYHFLSGYTAEPQIGADFDDVCPVATFSSCFGAGFMTHHPSVYANMLSERIERHGVACWLVNTGWLGGPCGVGTRIPIALTRTLLEAALEGRLDDAPFGEEPVFGLRFPRVLPGVPEHVLDPRAAWSDPAAYDRQANLLARLFAANFAAFATRASDGVRECAVILPSL